MVLVDPRFLVRKQHAGLDELGCNRALAERHYCQRGSRCCGDEAALTIVTRSKPK